MSHHRFHGSAGDVPFSWESRPGMSKVTPQKGEFPKAMVVGKENTKLPPPPCPKDSRPKFSSAGHGMYIPLPPCPFQQPPQWSSRSSKKGFKWEDDPFTAAYMECTKSVSWKQDKEKEKKKKKKRDRVAGLISCKHTCEVVEDGMVRLSQLPSLNLSTGKRYLEMKYWRESSDPREHSRPLIYPYDRVVN